MPLEVCVDGATGAGGAVFNSPMPRKLRVQNKSAILVGDSAICPGHETPQTSVIIAGAKKLQVGGKFVAVVGSTTTCGHSLSTSGQSPIKLNTD